MFSEAYTLAMIEAAGIPAPKVYGVEMFAGRMVVLMDHVKGDSLLDLMTKNWEKVGEYLDMVVKLRRYVSCISQTGT